MKLKSKDSGHTVFPHFHRKGVCAVDCTVCPQGCPGVIPLTSLIMTILLDNRLDTHYSINIGSSPALKMEDIILGALPPLKRRT